MRSLDGGFAGELL